MPGRRTSTRRQGGARLRASPGTTVNARTSVKSLPKPKSKANAKPGTAAKPRVKTAAKAAVEPAAGSGAKRVAAGIAAGGGARPGRRAPLKAATQARRSEAARAGTGKAELAAREAVIATALEMSRRGLSPGRSGNVSCRWQDGMLITPSGVDYAQIRPGDVVFVGADGRVDPGALKPSSEWRFHLSAYRARADIGAVVHVHSPRATVLACAHKPIPAFHYMVAVAGGSDIPLVPYATFGTEELAEYVADGLRRRNACLMANHGAIAVAGTLPAALELAAEVEILAGQYAEVLTLGPPHLLSDADMAEVLERFQSYGQNAQASSRETSRKRT